MLNVELRIKVGGNNEKGGVGSELTAMEKSKGTKPTKLKGGC